MKRINLLQIAVICLGIAGCQTYEEKPLVPAEFFEEVEQARNLGAAGQAETNRTITLTQAAQWLSQRGPSLIRARAEFRQADAVAKIKTPWPNPEVSAGLAKGFKLDSNSRSIQPMVEFGFSIPLSNRLSHGDDLNRALADEKLVDLITSHREAYLKLRALYIKREFAQKRSNLVGEIKASSAKLLDLTKNLVKAGAANALDVGLMELENANHRMEMMDANTEVLVAEQALALLLGLKPGLFKDAVFEGLPLEEASPPTLDEAKARLLEHHTPLARLRAHYEVAEKSLRLEIEKQIPDLNIGGPAFEGDPGESKKVLGLSIGVAIPLFDRNQQGIEQARQEREKVRIEYAQTLNEALTNLESLYQIYKVKKQKHDLIRKEVLPRSEANLKAALNSLKAASIDSLKYLEVERNLKSVKLDAIKSSEEIQDILVQIEQVIGAPFLLFPGEGPEDFSTAADIELKKQFNEEGL